MSDILDAYGKDSGAGQAARATNVGHCEPKPIPYSPPVGPSNINDSKSPGLHGTNHGNCGTQRK